MLCVLAGIPKAYVDNIESRLRRAVSGCVPLSIPANSSGEGWLRLSRKNAEELADRLLDYEARNSSSLSNGCGVLAFASADSNMDEFISYLEPTLIVKPVWLALSTRTIGKPGQIASNLVSRDVVKSALALTLATKHVQVEFSARLTRSPLHLPLRNFESKIFAAVIGNLARNLAQTNQYQSLISQACETIEIHHPFRKQGNRRSFKDIKSKRFLMPGRELHGVAHRGSPHNAMCVLSSKLRLGGALANGFHFDCVKNENDCLVGNLPNCHDADEFHRGHPHVNIGCNDGLRSTKNEGRQLTLSPRKP